MIFLSILFSVVNIFSFFPSLPIDYSPIPHLSADEYAFIASHIPPGLQDLNIAEIEHISASNYKKIYGRYLEIPEVLEELTADDEPDFQTDTFILFFVYHKKAFELYVFEKDFTPEERFYMLIHMAYQDAEVLQKKHPHEWEQMLTDSQETLEDRGAELVKSVLNL